MIPPPKVGWLFATSDLATPEEVGPQGEEALSTGVLRGFEDVQ